MKAIETLYKGYRFRSRLEARWGIFFDTLGIEWEYEHEGYDLDGIYYLPDFYITDFNIYCEVKPPGVLPETDLIKIRKLAFYKRIPVFLLDGTPTARDYLVFEYDPWSNTLFEIYEPLTEYSGDFAVDYDAAVNAARQARFEHGEQYAHSPV